jgi:hypothetical protein
MEDISKMKNSKYIFFEHRDFLEPPPPEFSKLMEDQRKEGKYIKSPFRCSGWTVRSCRGHSYSA